MKAIGAEMNGADRLELCSNLHLDGTTPEPTLISAVMHAVDIPVKVMIRPRAGDFVYDDAEFEEMREVIRTCKVLGVSGIATGVLTIRDTLDIQRLNMLAREAAPMTITIHKCIDLVPDVFEAITTLKHIRGVTAILSSGQSATAMEGRMLLRKMLQACGDDLTLIVAGKVTRENLRQLAGDIGAVEYHGRAIV